MSDYVKNDSWGNSGWLSDDTYYRHLAHFLEDNMAESFTGKTVADIGAGRARLWDHLLQQGVCPRSLHLIDPNLQPSAELSGRDMVILTRAGLEAVAPVSVDTVVFKQSLHHLVDIYGSDLSSMIKAEQVLTFSMPEDVSWPMSPDFRQGYLKSYSGIREHFNALGCQLEQALEWSYPVRLSRDEWCEMVKKRFTSVLHDVEAEFIEQEVHWAQENLAENLLFEDRLIIAKAEL